MTKMTLKTGFRSPTYDPKSKDPVEDLALGRYAAAVNAVQEYARENDFEIKDEEKSNIFAEMCEKRIGNFAHGFEHTILVSKEGEEKAFM